MKVAASRDPTASFNDFFFKKLQDMLTENLPNVERSDLPNLSACIQEYMSFSDKTQKVIKSSVNQENLSELHEVMRQT